MASRVMGGSAARHRQIELDDAMFARAREILVRRCKAATNWHDLPCYRCSKRPDFDAGQRGIHILSYLAHEGLICFGLHEGKQPTFVLLEEWVPPAKELERDAALAELARRYFTSHGPATVKDLMRWSGLTIKRRAGRLDTVRVIWCRRRSTARPTGCRRRYRRRSMPHPIVYLLPGFDEYLLGYGDRSAVLDPDYANEGSSRQQRHVYADDRQQWPGGRQLEAHHQEARRCTGRRTFHPSFGCRTARLRAGSQQVCRVSGASAARLSHAPLCKRRQAISGPERKPLGIAMACQPGMIPPAGASDAVKAPFCPRDRGRDLVEGASLRGR